MSIFENFRYSEKIDDFTSDFNFSQKWACLHILMTMNCHFIWKSDKAQIPKDYYYKRHHFSIKCFHENQEICIYYAIFFSYFINCCFKHLLFPFWISGHIGKCTQRLLSHGSDLQDMLVIKAVRRVLKVFLQGGP